MTLSRKEIFVLTVPNYSFEYRELWGRSWYPRASDTGRICATLPDTYRVHNLVYPPAPAIIAPNLLDITGGYGS